MFTCPVCKSKVKEMKLTGQEKLHCKECNWIGDRAEAIFHMPPMK